ncbi:MAG: TlpA family protein disulfide reductase [Myxococcales bacterium]|nr:TlpA family protein disulfide reductase [Myxococcales bacterium]
MTRPMAVMAAVCLLIAGCPQQELDAEACAEVMREAGCSDEDADVAPVAAARDLPQGAPTHAAPPSVVGERVAAFSDDWLQGQAEIDGVQLVVFFEIWCPHCRTEVPRLQALHEELSDDGFEVVGLTRMSRDVTEGQVLDFAKEHQLTYAIGRSDTPLLTQLQVRGIPAAALLKDGEVVWRGHPGRLKREQVTELLSG